MDSVAMSLTLHQNHVDQLGRILQELDAQSEADGCIVCDQAGYVIAQSGIAAEDPHLISALGAGVFAATGELAHLLGEDEFSVVLHQGTKRSILMCAVNPEVLLAVIFSAHASVGMVKLYAPLAASAIRAVVAVQDARPTPDFALSERGMVFNLR
jgi:predicted regulator of Ras-like GTPase activity (Roadblock/LC7/MglB family)